MVGSNRIPERGDVMWIDFDSSEGLEIRRDRPALVLSPSEFNRLREIAIVCPITKTPRPNGFDVDIPGGLSVTGFLRTQHFQSVSWQERNPRYHCAMPEDTVKEVCRRIETIVSGKDECNPYYVPSRGSVVAMDRTDDPVKALVLSSSEYNYWQRGFVICPIIDFGDENSTSSFEIKMKSAAKEFILADQVKSWDWWKRKARFVECLPEVNVEEVAYIVKLIVWG